MAEVGLAMASLHDQLRASPHYPAFIRAYNHTIDATDELSGIVKAEGGGVPPPLPDKWLPVQEPGRLIDLGHRPDRATRTWVLVARVVVFGGPYCPSCPQTTDTAIDELRHALELADRVAPGGGHLCIERAYVESAREVYTQ
jgi:hypothetical protein